MTGRFLEEFVEIYRSEPSLWNTKHKSYKNREIKAIAYQRLIDKLKEAGEEYANRTTVVRKINNLRTSFRKELKKVRAYKAQNIPYVPTLWYFDIFKSFLPTEDLQYPDMKEENDDSCEDNFSNSTNEPSRPKKIKYSLAVSNQLSPSNQPKDNHTNFYSNDSENNTTPMKRVDGNKSEDRFDIFGKHVAYKLRELGNIQRILAEKLINDTLFEAELENLTSEHKITALPD